MNNQKPMPPLWIFLPGLVFVIALAFLNAVKPRTLVILGAGLLAPCVLGMVCWLARSRFARMLASFVIVVYWVGLGALAAMMLYSGIAIVFHWGVFLLPMALAVIWATRSARKQMATRWISVGAGLGFACGVIVVTIVMASAIRKATQIFPGAPISRVAATR